MIPRTHNMIVSAHEFKKKQEHLKQRGFHCFEPMKCSNNTYCVTYIHESDLSHPAFRAFEDLKPSE